MPLSEEARNKLCSEAINQLLFDQVWNEPFSEFRVNIKPYLIRHGSIVGSFATDMGVILLPTAKESYFVWAMPVSDFNIGLQLPTSEWISTADICNQWNTLIQTYHSSGAMFHKAFVYMRYNAMRQVIYIAVLKRMAMTMLPAWQAVEEVYLTVYYDSDSPRDARVCSVEIPPLTIDMDAEQRAVDEIMYLLEDPCQLQVYKDGIEITEGAPTLEAGHFYDVVVDRNIKFAFDVELTTTRENPVFLSDMDSTWKQLIHIPKELNPDNKIITHNTCDIFVRRKLVEHVEGRYLHRAAGKRSVTQVTHNDMAVPLFVLDAYRDYLQDQHIYLHVVCRVHDKDNVLIQDASYINLLYSEVHDDDRIIEILVGNGPETIPWWKASELEKSPYVLMFFDTPNFATMDHMEEYVDALGFYHVVNILCRRVVDTSITDAFHGILTFALPLLYTGMTVVPVVYLNKKAIFREYVSYTNNEDGTVTIQLDDSVITHTGDQLSVIFFVDGDHSIYEYTLSDSLITVTVPYEDANIYLKHPSASSVAKGISGTSTVSYTKLEKNANHFVIHKNGDGTADITFNDKYLGETILIESAYCTYSQSFELTPWTQNGSTIAIPLVSELYGTDETRPIINFQNISVYVNGMYLVRGVDYFINDVKDSDGNISFRELVVQTMDHFAEGQIDRLDILINMAEIEDISAGFVINNRLTDISPVNLYFPNISTVHVGGLLERDVEYKGVFVDVMNADYPHGTVFEIQTSVPKIVKDFITKYTTNRDLARIVALNEYFYSLVKVVPDILVMERKNRIYSTFMNAFIKDVLNGTIKLIDDPDVNRMKQTIQPYFYLKDMDLCFAGLDERFIDYYPQYVNYEVDARAKRFIDKFIDRFMPENTDPTVEVVYGRQ